MMAFTYKNNLSLHILSFILLTSITTYLNNNLSWAKEEAAAGFVFDLEEEEFKTFLTKHDPVMVMFYSPQCGHCHKMKPEYEKLSGTLQKMGIKAHVARIDGTENKKVISEEKIDGFPTLKLYSQETSYDYKGERTSQAMSKWIKKMTGPAVISLKNDSSIEADSDEGYFIGYFKDEDTELYKVFKNVATSNRMLSSYFSVIPTEEEQIIAVKEDEEKIVFDGKTEEELKNFITTEAYPKLAIITPGNFEKYLQRELDFAWFDGTNLQYQSYEKSIREASKSFKNQLCFVWVDSELYSSKQNMGEPSFMLNLLNGTRYEMPNPMINLSQTESIIQFLNNALDGKIDPYLKSDDIPETNDEPVKVVVAKNLMQQVFQPDKDVMLEVYAPWCGHCKHLEPVYNEVATHFQSNPKVLIAKMDGTTNESPSPKFDWKGFPTLFFIKGGEDTPIPYNGQRTKQAIIDFIMENGSNSNSLSKDEL